VSRASPASDERYWPGIPATPAAVQAHLDDLGTPRIDVESVVLGLETTGGSPTSDRVTEVGAVKVRGGEVVGSSIPWSTPRSPSRR